MASLNTNNSGIGHCNKTRKLVQATRDIGSCLELESEEITEQRESTCAWGAAASPQQQSVGNSARALPNAGTLNPTYFIDDVQKLCLLLEKVWTWTDSCKDTTWNYSVSSAVKLLIVKNILTSSYFTSWMPNAINSNKMHKIILVVEKQGTNEALCLWWVGSPLKHDWLSQLSLEKKTKTFRNFSCLKISVKSNTQSRHTDLRAAHRPQINIQKHHDKGQGSS